MKNGLKLAALSAAVVVLAGCATVTRGTRQKMFVMSEPSGAKVDFVGMNQTCKTPCKVKMKRRKEFSATITKEGFKPITVPVKHVFKGGGMAGGMGNVLLGGIPGLIVDGASGSMQSLGPNPINVVLAPVDSAEESKFVKSDKPKGGKFDSVAPTEATPEAGVKAEVAPAPAAPADAAAPAPAAPEAPKLEVAPVAVAPEVPAPAPVPAPKR
jgi:predicted lipid-binding transport protein (Tim44 family)